MLTGFKSPWSSKTILTAIAMGLSLLGTIGVKWFTDDQNVKHVMDVVDAVIAVLGSTGVIAFRASATKQVTTNAAKLRSSSSPTVTLPLLLVLLIPLAVMSQGCAALGLKPGESVVASTPAGRADQALSLYASTLHELNDLRQAGQLSDETARNVVEPARAAAWAAVTAMCAQAQVSPAEDTQAFEDAASKFGREVARMIAAKLAPKQQAASATAKAPQATSPAPAPPQAVEVPLSGP